MEISVRSSILIFWLRTKLTLTETMVNGSSPNTLYGLIPIGRNEVSQPLNRISRVQVSTRVEGVMLVAGLLAAFLTILVFVNGSAGSVVLGVLFALVAVVALSSSYRAEFVITDNGGGTQKVLVSPLDRDVIKSFGAEVNRRLASQTP